MNIDILCRINSNNLMFMRLTLEALEVIDAIEHKGSFAGAAAVLNKVPSAISYTVQKLEQDLSVTLFQKEGRRAVLTSAGRHLAEQGRLLLTAADELVAGTQQVATGWEPRLRIAVDTLVPIEEVLPHLAALHEEQSTIEVSLVTEVLAGTWEALIENRVDLVIGGVGEAPRHQGVRCERWREYKHVFVAAPDHPLCSEHQPISTETAERYRGIIIPDSSRNSTPLTSRQRFRCPTWRPSWRPTDWDWGWVLYRKSLPQKISPPVDWCSWMSPKSEKMSPLCWAGRPVTGGRRWDSCWSDCGRPREPAR
jgi:DNA-binding transcriptional LysR family regulator